MSLTTKKDRLSVEYTELKEQLNGINPKLSSYQKILKRISEIEKEIGGKPIGLVKMKKTRTKKGKYIAPFQGVHG